MRTENEIKERIESLRAEVVAKKEAKFNTSVVIQKLELEDEIFTIYQRIRELQWVLNEKP